MNISFNFSIFKEFSSGSVWELYLLSVMILVALFCNFMSLCVLKPHICNNCLMSLRSQAASLVVAEFFNQGDQERTVLNIEPQV